MTVGGEIPIRPHQFKNPLIVQRVLGIDANSLHLSCVASTNSTVFFCRYKKGKLLAKPLYKIRFA